MDKVLFERYFSKIRGCSNLAVTLKRFNFDINIIQSRIKTFLGSWFDYSICFMIKKKKKKIRKIGKKCGRIERIIFGKYKYFLYIVRT